MHDGDCEGQEVTIRRATARDRTAIVEIARTLPWDKERYLERQIERGDVLVAVRASTVTGFVAWNAEFFSLPFVWLLVVAPAFRRRGIAGRLFDAVERACSGKRLFASTNLSDAVMQRFFERRGYRRSGEVDVDFGDPEIFYQIDLR